MKAIAMEYIHAAQEALDEGAVKAAKRLMDLAVQQLNEQPSQTSIRIRPQVQATLLTGESSAGSIDAALRDWVADHVGETISHATACQWIEESSGIHLTWADRQRNHSKSQIWRGHVSTSILKLKADGILGVTDEDGKDLPRTHYLVLRKP